METLSRTLERAQRAVLRVQGDLTTLRAQLEDEDDDHKAAVVNPFYIELQGTVQKKQEVAADLLQKSAHQLFEVYRHVEARAERLTHVQDKEKQLSSAKKTMRRYLEAQALAQDAVTEDVSDALRLEEMKVEHLQGAAADLVASTAQRAVQRRVLFTWLKRAMVRVFAREQAETYRGSVDSTDILAQRYSLKRLVEARQRKALHHWERRMHRRRLDKCQSEVVEMRTSAEFFQTELAKTQKLMSQQLDEVMTHARQTSDNKTSECDLLSDEVRRLKVALEDVTNEFGDRTRTYVRQQEEAELFYKHKEDKMKASLDTLQVQLSALQCQNAQLKLECQHLSSSAVAHAAHAAETMAALVQRKSDVYAGAVSNYCCRLKQYNLSLQDEVRQLRADVTLLAPLGESTVHLEDQLSATRSLLDQERAKTNALHKTQKQSMCTMVLLTDRLHASETRQARQAYWHRWRSQAESKRRQDTEVRVCELTQQMKEKQAEFLVHQQRAAAEYHEQLERVNVELEDRARVCQSMKQDVARSRARLDELEEQLYHANLESANLSAKLTRAQMNNQTFAAQWLESNMSLLAAREGQERADLMRQEAALRGAFALREMAVVQIMAGAKAQEVDQAMAVCESWQAHCIAQDAAYATAQTTMRASAASAQEAAELRRRTASTFLVWRHWASIRQCERTWNAQLQKTREEAAAATDTREAEYGTAIDSLRAQLHGAVQQHERELADLRAASEKEAERLEQQMRRLQHDALERDAQLQAHRVALQKAEERAIEDARAREEAHTAVLTEAKETMDAAMQQLREDHNCALSQVHRAHKQALLHARMEAEAERRALLERHAANATAQEKHHAEVVARVETERGDWQEEARRLGMTVVEYCARSSLHAWRAWSEKRRRDRFEAQMPQLVALTTHFLADRYNLTLNACTAQHDVFTTATAALVSDMSVTHRAQSELFEAHKAIMVDHVASLKTDAETHCVARRAAEARADQLTHAVQEASDDKATLKTALEVAQAERDALQDALATAQTTHRDAELTWRRRAEEDAAAQHRALAIKQAAAQMETAFVEAQLHEYGVYHTALATHLVSAWHEARLRQSLTEVEDPSCAVAETDQSSRRSSDDDRENKPSGVVERAFPPEMQQWVAQLEQATLSLRTSTSDQTRTTTEAAVAVAAAQRILECLEKSLGDTAPTATVSAGADTKEQSLPAVADRSDVAQTVTHAIEVVRAAATEAIAEAERQHAAEIEALQVELDAARQAHADLRASMEDLLAESRALAEDMKTGEAAAVRARSSSFPPSSSVSPSSSSSSCVSSNQMWAERLAQTAQRYQRVLDAMYDGIKERRETFHSVNGMLIEVNTFSEELLHRFEENVKALQALQSQLHQRATPRHDGVKSDEGSGDDRVSVQATSPSPTAPLSPVEPWPAALELSPLSKARDASAEAPLAQSDAPRVSYKAMCLPSHQPSQQRRGNASRAGSSDREQLIDRVYLLEKLLAQAKVQVAQAREMVDMAEVSARPAAAAAGEAVHQVWAERATRDIETLQLPLTESELVSLYAANAEAMVVCMDTLRQRAHLQAVESRRQEDALAESAQAAAALSSREKQEWENKVRQLSQSMQILQQRHVEAIQQGEDAVQEVQRNARQQAERLEANMQAVRANYEQELALLEAEVDRAQADMERARVAHRDALADQKALLDAQCEQTVQSYERQLRQLERERDHAAQQRQQLETDCDRAAADHKRALAQLQASHRKALDALEARYSRYYVEQAQGHAVSEQGGRHLAQTGLPLETIMHETASRDTLLWQALTTKSEMIMEAAVQCGEAIGLNVMQQEREREREEWETETVHLKERLAHLEATTPLDPYTEKREEQEVERLVEEAVQADICTQQRTCSSSVSPRSQAARGTSSSSCSPAALTASRSPTSLSPARASAGPRPSRSRPDVVGVSDDLRVSPAGSGTTAPVHATTLQTPVKSDDLFSPPLREPQSTTPIRTRGYSVDSLDLSQSMLRYSKMLTEQTDRNEERLQHACFLEAEVNDLIDRGTRLSEMAERSGLTPRRHHPR